MSRTHGEGRRCEGQRGGVVHWRRSWPRVIPRMWVAQIRRLGEDVFIVFLLSINLCIDGSIDLLRWNLSRSEGVSSSGSGEGYAG